MPFLNISTKSSSHYLFYSGLLSALTASIFLSKALAWGSSILLGATGWLLLSLGTFLAFKYYSNNTLANLSILVSAILSRIVLINTPFSDDLYRYVWEGQLVLDGLNPYLISPNSESLNFLVQKYPSLSSIRPLINHPDLPGIYPPIAQYFLSVFSFFSHSPQRLQNLFQLVELTLLLGVIKLVKQHKLPLKHVVLYSLNPIVLISLFSEAHLDVLGISLCVWAYFLKSNHPKISWFLFGIAVLIKYPLLCLLPALLFRKEDLKGLLFFTFPFLSFIPFLLKGAAWGSLSKFATDFRFNAGPWELLAFLNFSQFLSSLILLIILSFLIWAIWWFESRRYFVALLSTSLCVWFMPTVHPWYLGLMIPFWCLFPLRSLGLMHWCLPLIILPMLNTHLEFGIWNQSAWLSPSLWFGGLFLVLFDISKHSTSIPEKEIDTSDLTPPSLSMVIPLKNEEGQINTFITTLFMNFNHESFKGSFELVFVDGGSTDKTLELLKEVLKNQLGTYSLKVSYKILVQSGGRGPQIDYGIRNSKNNTILITHIDTSLSDFSFNKLINLLKENPTHMGGACNMKFSPYFKGSKVIETLNNLRIKWGALAFGDQMIFFRKDWYFKNFESNALSPLMEDVELSIALRESGPWLLPKDSITISSRRWLEKGSSQNSKLVIYILFIYLFARKFIGSSKAAAWAKNKYYA